MTGRNWSALIFSATALIFMSAAAQAQAPSKAQQDAIRGNCRSDFIKNCSSVKPGGREALECLMQNKANVSGGCQAALNAVSAPAAAKPEPKAEPVVEPAAAPPAGSATAAPHSPEAPKAPPPAAGRSAPKAATAPVRPVPPPPAAASAPPPADDAALGAHRPMRLGEAFVIRRFCSNDFKVLCKGVQLGQGRAVKCLADNRDALSPGCKQAMAKAGN